MHILFSLTGGMYYCIICIGTNKIIQYSRCDNGLPFSYACSGQCENIRRFPASQQCSFVRNTTACHMDGGFLNYLHLPYCVLAGYEAAGLVIIFLWMMYIFFSLSLVVDLVLCPSLKVRYQCVYTCVCGYVLVKKPCELAHSRHRAQGASPPSPPPPPNRTYRGEDIYYNCAHDAGRAAQAI